jgi:uncharacterized protein with PIN domain
VNGRAAADGKALACDAAVRHAGRVEPVEIRISFDPRLHLFLGAAHRAAEAPLRCDGVSSLGHVVESLGVPLTEVGALTADGEPARPGHVPRAGERVRVEAVAMPQRLPGVRSAHRPDDDADDPAAPPRFLLDIHLGTLARRMRVLGLDTAYESPDIGDAALAARSAAERRIMLSRDRGLLRRRELFAGAFVYSTQPARQLDEVLTRFAPPLAPWTRCTACNGELREIAKEDVRDRLPSGTERTYETFAECSACGQTFWRGAHAQKLDTIVEHALERVREAGSGADAAAGNARGPAPDQRNG